MCPDTFRLELTAILEEASDSRADEPSHARRGTPHPRSQTSRSIDARLVSAARGVDASTSCSGSSRRPKANWRCTRAAHARGVRPIDRGRRRPAVARALWLAHAGRRSPSMTLFDLVIERATGRRRPDVGADTTGSSSSPARSRRARAGARRAEGARRDVGMPLRSVLEASPHRRVRPCDPACGGVSRTRTSTIPVTGVEGPGDGHSWRRIARLPLEHDVPVEASPAGLPHAGAPARRARSCRSSSRTPIRGATRSSDIAGASPVESTQSMRPSSRSATPLATARPWCHRDVRGSHRRRTTEGLTRSAMRRLPPFMLPRVQRRHGGRRWNRFQVLAGGQHAIDSAAELLGPGKESLSPATPRGRVVRRRSSKATAFSRGQWSATSSRLRRGGDRRRLLCRRRPVLCGARGEWRRSRIAAVEGNVFSAEVPSTTLSTPSAIDCRSSLAASSRVRRNSRSRHTISSSGSARTGMPPEALTAVAASACPHRLCVLRSADVGARHGRTGSRGWRRRQDLVR